MILKKQNKGEIKMMKSIRKILLTVLTCSCVSLFADTTDVSWGDGTPGTLEAAITGPGVYRLEAGKIYLTLEHIPVVTGAIHLVGATPQGDQFPATIQPMANVEGSLGHTNGELFTVVGDGAELALKGLNINAAAFGGEGSLHGCASARGAMNKIIVDNTVISHVAHLAFFTMGTQTDFHITNSVVKAFTNGPGGMFYGGLVWGAGSWMGTIDTLVVQNNTIDGVIGEGLVIYEHVDHGIVDHNTFTNIVMDIIWYRGQNNLQVTNNLLYNTKSYGSSTYDVSGWGVWWAGGAGQMALRKAGIVNPSNFLDITPAVVEITPADTSDDCTITPEVITVITAADTVIINDGTYVMGDGQVVDMNNRNINWHNNAAVWSPALTTWMDNMAATPWGWDVTTVTPDSISIVPAVLDTTCDGAGNISIVETTAADTTTYPGTGGTTVVTVPDTMLTVAQQLVWADDSTLATIAMGTGVTSTMNPVLSSTDLGMNLDEMYIEHQLARTLDFRDDQTTQGVGATNNWQYEHDGNSNLIEWPMHYNASYSAASAAATHCTHGGPIGSTRWMDHTAALATDNTVVLPRSFALKQNYPNPFNPSTEIAFSLEQSSTINLTIFNVLGQKVKVLAEGSKQAGTHTLSWDGRDEMGAAVSTGLYFYKLTDGNNSVTKKMALMK
jgi:hypothetical protein